MRGTILNTSAIGTTARRDAKRVAIVHHDASMGKDMVSGRANALKHHLTVTLGVFCPRRKHTYFSPRLMPQAHREFRIDCSGCIGSAESENRKQYAVVASYGLCIRLAAGVACGR